MSSFFFSGSFETKLDVKGRFVLPQEMRYGLIEKGALEFTLAIGLGGSLAIYRKTDMEAIVRKFQEKQHLAKYQPFFTLFFSLLYPSTCDKIGRVTLPAPLKKAANLKTELVIVGVMDKIEIWAKDRYDAQIKEALDPHSEEMKTLSEEAFALLGGGSDGAS